MTRQTFAALIGFFLFVSTIALGLGFVDSARQGSTLAASPVASPSPAATPLTIRQILATGLPPSTPGQTLDLARYDIPPGTTLAVHVHPGMQIAWVESGMLTYHVIKGEVQIGRAVNASGGQPGATETLAAGQSTVLMPGDWVVEIPGAVHYGENLGTSILSSGRRCLWRPASL